jgi:hypothetical protein
VLPFRAIEVCKDEVQGSGLDMTQVCTLAQYNLPNPVTCLSCRARQNLRLAARRSSKTMIASFNNWSKGLPTNSSSKLPWSHKSHLVWAHSSRPCPLLSVRDYIYTSISYKKQPAWCLVLSAQLEWLVSHIIIQCGFGDGRSNLRDWK